MTEKDDLFDAYVFAFPLVIMDATMKNMTNVTKPKDTSAPMGMIGHSSTMANADSRFVVTPNVDTLYSIACIDLSRCPYILDIPDADRYVSYELLDAYTNCVAVFGSGMELNEGKYAIFGPKGGDDIPGCTSIRIGTSLVWMIVRIVCADPKNAKEMAEINAIRDRISLKPADGVISEGRYDPDLDYTPVKYVVTMNAEEFFDRFNALSADNPPSADDEKIMKKIAYLGIGPGLHFDPDKLSFESREMLPVLGNLFVKNITDSKKKYQHDVNGWMYWDSRMADFGTEYAFRALVALGGLGANPVKMAVYPFCETDSDKEPMNGNNRYSMHLDRLPPVKEYGFWSFTLYGDDDFLVANPIERYCINDRSDLVLNGDGSLDITISATGEGLDNWLPCGDGGFHLVLRVYLPSDDVISEKWIPPSVVKL